MIHVAMIGAGAISGIYLKNLTETCPGGQHSSASAHLMPERAEKAAALLHERSRKKGIAMSRRRKSTPPCTTPSPTRRWTWC